MNNTLLLNQETKDHYDKKRANQRTRDSLRSLSRDLMHQTRKTHSSLKMRNGGK